jgi:hypothetical protein
MQSRVIAPSALPVLPRFRAWRRFLAPGWLAAALVFAAMVGAQFAKFTHRAPFTPLVGRGFPAPILRYLSGRPLWLDPHAFVINFATAVALCGVVGGLVQGMRRYSIRTLLLATLVLAVGFGLARQRFLRWNQANAAVTRLEQTDLCLAFRESVLPTWTGDWYWIESLPKWIWQDVTEICFVGECYVGDSDQIVAIELTQADVERLLDLPHLNSLMICRLDDAAVLRPLRRHTGLKRVNSWLSEAEIHAVLPDVEAVSVAFTGPLPLCRDTVQRKAARVLPAAQD